MDPRPVGFLQTKGLVKTSLILSYPLISIIYIDMKVSALQGSTVTLVVD